MAEADNVALAGTIGTWVAVVLAIIALIAVVGPVLVWAAARSERNKALQHAGDAKQPFISSGVHFVGFNVRLFRRVRAPMLDKTPENPVLTWDARRFVESKSHATFIQFANLLGGYGVHFRKGDTLRIYRGRTLLPVHRIWILVIGLVGRYSTARGRAAGQRRSISRTVTGSVVKFKTSTSDRVEGSSEDEPVESIPWSIQASLNGVTGQIKVTDKVSRFRLPATSPPPTIVLVELWTNDALHLDDEPLDEDAHVPSWKPKFRKKVSWTITDIVKSRRRLEEDEVQQPVALRLDKVVDEDEEMEQLTSPFGEMTEELLGFEPQPVDVSLSIELKRYMGATFVDPSVPWIRVPKIDGASEQPSNIFIWRADAQKIAHGLLNLPWHPEGYLIGGSSAAYCIQMLEFAERKFLYLLARVRENIDVLDISPQEKLSLADSFNSAEKQAYKGQSALPRSSHRVLYHLDKLLASSGHKEAVVNDMIGILMMTKEEFASFVHQSARHLDKNIRGTLEVVLRTALVKVILPFGGIQDYVLDMEHIYPDWKPRDEAITVNSTLVMLACLKACLRSFLLKICFDGYPLMQEIMKMDNVVYVA